MRSRFRWFVLRWFGRTAWWVLEPVYCKACGHHAYHCPASGCNDSSDQGCDCDELAPEQRRLLPDPDAAAKGGNLQ